ncbi:inosine triphosphate pyrophosphatase-like protein, partial [Pavlovales sp. CCMP2436]
MSAEISQIVVGSANDVKVQAVAQALAGYPRFATLLVVGFKAPSAVSEQPRNMEETLRGARNRARAAFASRATGVQLAFGIESGVFEMGEQAFDVCACVAFDGTIEAVGWSSAFQIPPSVAGFVREGMDLSQASSAAGISADPKLGSGQGLIGLLSDGRIDRLEYTKQAVTVCMIGIDRKALYSTSSELAS